MRKRILLILSVTALACDKDPTDGGSQPSLTLSADSIGVSVGGAAGVTATLANTTSAVRFESRNAMVATAELAAAPPAVNGSVNGVIRGLAAGRTIVVGSLVSNPEVRDSVIVVVGTGLQLPVLGTGQMTDRWTAEVAVAEPYAYTSTWGGLPRQAPGNAVKIWNVSGNAPMLIDSLIIANAATLGDVQISSDGRLLVVAIEGGPDNGIAIFDRTNPAKPTLITRFTTVTTRQGVHTLKLSRINGREYAFLAIDPSGAAPAKLDIVDITDPVTASEVYTAAMGQPFVHDVFVRDGVLFAALWHTGLTIFDVGGAGRGGTPSAPVQLGTVKTANCSTCGAGASSVHNVWWFHDPSTGSKRYAFVGEEGPANLGGFLRASGDVHVVDVSDFNSPREVAFYQPDSTTTATGRMGGAHNFVMDEASGILYAAYYNAGVRALDVRGDLSACTAVQQASDGRCDLRKMGREVAVALNTNAPKFVWGVARQGTNLYASDMPNGLHKLSIAGLQR